MRYVSRHWHSGLGVLVTHAAPDLANLVAGSRINYEFIATIARATVSCFVSDEFCSAILIEVVQFDRVELARNIDVNKGRADGSGT